VPTISVVLCPTTKIEISFAARYSSPASSTIPAMKSRWSQPSSMCSMPSGTKPSTLRLAAEPTMSWANASGARPSHNAAIRTTVVLQFRVVGLNPPHFDRPACL